MKIILDTKNYTPFKYDEFLDETKLGDSPYVVGQVVVCMDEEADCDTRFVMGVILGCIGHKTEEVRTDAIGMTTYDKIRPANILDFSNRAIACAKKIKLEAQGYKVTFDWNSYKLIVED